MSDGSSIEWTDATWQPTLGCERVSPGCDKCYAMRQLHRGMCEQHQGLTKIRPKSASRPGIDWNGTIRLQPEVLGDPLRWRNPRRVFVDSLSDLFHHRVPFPFIAAVFGTMAATPRHTYLLLTKRDPRPFYTWLRSAAGEGNEVTFCAMAAAALDVEVGDGATTWPLPNVQLGASVENLDARERLDWILQCPAALHWASFEPLLEDLGDLSRWLPERAHLGYVGPELRAKGYTEGPVMLSRGKRLGWAVIGGESGPGARSCRIEWARSIIRQFVAVGVPPFMKQLGSNPSSQHGGARLSHGGRHSLFVDRGHTYEIRSGKGKDMHEWPPDLRVREVP